MISIPSSPPARRSRPETLRRSLWLLLIAFFAVLGCGPVIPEVPEPVSPDKFRDGAEWLCLPGRADACARDLTATEIRPDGMRTIEHFVPATQTKADCFYVYPTVDLGLTPRVHEDFSSIEPMAQTTLAQAARFQKYCSLYVPLYRQISIGLYMEGGQNVRRGLAVAFSDIEAAFTEYLTHFNRGRPIVLMGHSQGSDMIARVIERFFENDPELRARLLVAMVIGGNVDAPPGQLAGGTFTNVPICTSANQTSCVVSYRTYAAGEYANAGPAAPKAGRSTLCVNPADIEGNTRHLLSASYLPSNARVRPFLYGISDVRTPWVVFRNFYAARCVEGDGAFRYLEVGPAGMAGDVRVNPIDFSHVPGRALLGLHIVDFQLSEGDLLEIVARRVAALP